MRHAGSEFEIRNADGNSTFQDLTTDATPGVETSLPASPDKFIERFVLENRAPIVDERTANVNIDSTLEYSIDGGSSWDSLFAGQGVDFEPKGIQQIKVRSSDSPSLPYRVTFTFERFDETR